MNSDSSDKDTHAQPKPEKYVIPEEHAKRGIVIPDDY